VEVASANGSVELRPSVEPDRDPSVAIWAARGNADLLAGAIGRPVEVADPA
jgi:hypothetical protein